MLLPLEYTFNSKGWASFVFWGCSRQSNRKTETRISCARGLRDFVNYVLRHQCSNALHVKLQTVYAQHGATVEHDGTISYTIALHGGHVDLKTFWPSIPEQQRSMFSISHSVLDRPATVLPKSLARTLQYLGSIVSTQCGLVFQQVVVLRCLGILPSI